MAKKAAKKRTKRAKAPAKQPTLDQLFETAFPPVESAAVGDASLHDLFQQQTMEMLDRSDLSEEQKQSILVAMNCPCCGGSGLSFTMKLKRES
ncbi:MAG: hypothetical protein K2Y71_16770 [Xanthobacteraceae bacterium]|nr:hypothetical protein [Xanthobacteraceae bacterium]